MSRSIEWELDTAAVRGQRRQSRNREDIKLTKWRYPAVAEWPVQWGLHRGGNGPHRPLREALDVPRAA